MTDIVRFLDYVIKVCSWARSLVERIRREQRKLAYAHISGICSSTIQRDKVLSSRRIHKMFGTRMSCLLLVFSTQVSSPYVGFLFSSLDRTCCPL